MSYRLILAIILSVVFNAKASDTLHISVQQADSIFLQKNLHLLAAQFHVDAQEALKIQARLWPNPSITFELNAIDPQNKRYFNAGNEGQKSLVIEQLILTAGKRKDQIAAASLNADLAHSELADLLRELRYKLYLNYFEAYQQIQLITTYDRQLVVLDSLISIYNRQAKKGNITIKEVIRLKSAYFSLNNERSSAFFKLNEAQREIRMFIQTEAFVRPSKTEPWLNKLEAAPDLKAIQDSAILNRPDLRMAKLEYGLSSLNLKIQKKQNIPDINLLSAYDQRGGAFNNQINIGLGISLPAWNRNTGNIRHASFRMRETEILAAAVESNTRLEVLAAWDAMRTSISEFKKINRLYSSEFDEVIEGVNENFRKRNISMLEFVDFFEAYISSEAEFERVRAQLAFSAAYLNYVTASAIY